MTVAAGAKGRVFRLASRVVLHGHARPVVDGVAQANVGGLAHEHDAALAGSLGDGDPRQASKRSIVSPLQGLEGLGQQRRRTILRPLEKIVKSSDRAARAAFQCGRLQVLIQKNSFEQGMYTRRQVGGEWLATGLGGVLHHKPLAAHVRRCVGALRWLVGSRSGSAALAVLAASQGT